MRTIYSQLIGVLLRMLPPADRDAVLGDVLEQEMGNAKKLWELSGLVMRQQVLLWRGWQPWVALLAVAGVAGLPLARMAGGSWAAPGYYLSIYRHYGVLYHGGLSPGEEIVIWSCNTTAIVLWSWCAGGLLATFSPKTWKLTLMLIGAAWLCWLAFHPYLFIGLIGTAQLILVLLPATSGMRHSLRGDALGLRAAWLIALASAALLGLMAWTSGWQESGIERWSEGSWRGGSVWYSRLWHLWPRLLMSWPAAAMLVLASLQRKENAGERNA